MPAHLVPVLGLIEGLRAAGTIGYCSDMSCWSSAGVCLGEAASFLACCWKLQVMVRESFVYV
jgi:hypothetical protein